ncbi:hypothetical protein D3C80_1336730 [compost metagenome]
MQGQEVYIVIAEIKHSGFPFGKGRHASARAAAGDELQVGVNPAHCLGRFVGKSAVFNRCFGADLPRAVHLIPKTPGLEVVRVFNSVGNPQITIVRS